jgi:hypothetical protein
VSYLESIGSIIEKFSDDILNVNAKGRFFTVQKASFIVNDDDPIILNISLQASNVLSPDSIVLLNI